MNYDVMMSCKKDILVTCTHVYMGCLTTPQDGAIVIIHPRHRMSQTHRGTGYLLDPDVVMTPVTPPLIEKPLPKCVIN